VHFFKRFTNVFARFLGPLRDFVPGFRDFIRYVLYHGILDDGEVLVYPPHHIDFSLKTVTDVETGEPYTLIFGVPTEQYPDGIGVLTQAQLNDYVRLC
jgi:hypothetical protein